MPGIPRKVAEHSLHIKPGSRPVKQRLRRFDDERRATIGEELKKLLAAGFVKGVVTEPPKLYGPHAPIIVPRTSDSYACDSNNLIGPIECPSRINRYRGIAILQQFIQIIYIRVKSGSLTIT